MLNKTTKNTSSNVIKKLYINNSSKNKTNINYNQEELTNLNSKKNNKNDESCSGISNMSKNKANYNILNNNINLRTMKNYNQNNMNYNIIDNISLYYKYLNNEKNNNIRKSIDKNNSAPNIFFHNNNNSSNLNRKKLIKNYLNKINNLKNDGKNVYLSNRNDLNFITKENSLSNIYNIKNNEINYSTKSNLKKLPYNITNNTIIMNKNDEMINLNTSIIGEVDNFNIKKLKVEQKLVEYHKMIDMKVDELMKDKKFKLYQKKKRVKSCDDNKKMYSSKSKINKKFSKVSTSSDYGRNKKSSSNFSNTNYINNENTKNIPDKITILPKRIKDNGKKIIYNPLINKDNFNKNKLKKIVKNTNMKGKIYLDSYNEMMNKKNIYY